MTCRAFLGIAEAMYGPGVPLYLSFFYPRERVGFRHGMFISGAAMANAYGGALAYGLSHIKGSLAPWKILFLIEGLPTCVMAVVAWFFLPDSIATARFLNDREKAVAERFVARNQRPDSGDEKTGIRFHQLLEAFKDPKSMFCMLYSGCVCCDLLTRSCGRLYSWTHVLLLQRLVRIPAAVHANHHQ